MNKPNKAKGGRPVLIVTTIGSFLMPVALSAVNVALPSIGKDLAMVAISLSWIALAFTLSAGMFLVPFGKLADTWGQTKIFIAGNWVFTIASFFLTISPSPWMLIAFRAMQGLGAAMLFGTVLAILVAAYPLEERGKVLGINVASVYLGLSFGPFIGGVLTQNIGWRSVFFLNVPLGLANTLLSMWKLPRDPDHGEQKGGHFDLLGSFIYCAMLFSLLYGFSLLPDTVAMVFVGGGVVGIAIFVWWEGRVGQPVLDINLFMRNRGFTLSNMAALINYAATFAVAFLLSFYLQHIKGLSPQNAGLVLVCQPVVQAILSPVAGRLSDRVEPRILASLGMGTTALCLFILASFGTTTSLTAVVLTLGLLGVGFAFFSSPNMNAIMSSVEDKFHGVASSMVATVRLLGQMFSMGIAMLTFAIFMGQMEISPPLYPSLLKAIKTAFTIFGLLCIVGAFTSSVRGNLRPGIRQD
jgi:EmrB/QacA subfamily drug resistance transporter